MRTLARLLLASMLLLGLTACPPRAVLVDGRTMGVDEAARYELENARARERAGDVAGAAEMYETVARRYADSVEADEALFGAGQAWEKVGQTMRARAAYELLLSRYPRSDKAALAQARVTELSAGDAALAAAVAAFEALPEEQKYGAAVRNAEQAEAAGNGLEAWRWREEALKRVPANQRAEAEAALTNLLRLLPPAEVENLRVDRESPAAPLLAWRQSQLHQERRDWDELEESLAAFVRDFPTHPLAAEARALLAKIEMRGEVAPTKIGVILPLSGPYKAYGEQIRTGIEFALRSQGAPLQPGQQPPPRIEVVYRDTRGDAEGAKAAIERLMYEDHVIAVIGGVITAEVDAAALAADELGLPFVGFSRTEGFAAASEWVFRDMLTNSAIADALVDFTMGTRGMRNFAVLHPEIEYGEEMRDLFWQRVEERGGKIRGVESYPQETTTFSEPIRNLVQKQNIVDRAEYQRKLNELRARGIKDARKRRNALEKIKASISPVIEFEALLVPDHWKTVALVAPALAFEDVITNWCDKKDIERIEKTTGQKVKPVMLIGGNTWNHRDLPARAGKYINCSVFVDGFHAGSSRPETVHFVGAFSAQHGRAPGMLEAYGAEAATVVRAVLEQVRPANRRAFQEALLSVNGLAGPMGPISVTEEGEIVHPLYLLTIDRGVIREADPTLADGAL